MKKYILFLAVFLTGFSASFATGTSVEDLVGQYECTNAGITATFELNSSATGFVLDYCREFGQMECFSATVFKNVVAGQILGVEGQTHRALEDLKVEVVENGNDITIRVSTQDGITLEFTK